ncbi:PAS domain S-box protein [Granulicella paludicola]|uniref:PAS domain S-box protein n=1 Tax=Granulicella paludicola TaxID=474951 RepID=UPI0021E0F33E|nr:PAS domain S-box protein [Granulicella paludicola]
MNPLRACALTGLISAFAVFGAVYFHAPFSSLLVASMITSYFAGRKAGLFVIALSALAFYLLFLEPGKGPAITAIAVGRPAFFIGAMICFTELIHARRRSERSKMQSEVEFQALVATCPDCILILDAQQIIRFSNPAVARLFGYSIEEVIGKPASLLLPEASSGQLLSGELLGIHKRGQPIYVESSCGRFSDKTTVSLRDISDRKRTQAQLEASAANLRLTLDTIPGLVYSRPPDGELDYANRHLMGFFGYTLEGVRNGVWRDGLHPDERESVLEKMTLGSALGKPYSFECRHRLDDGTYGWIHSAVEPLIGPDGQVIRWYGLITDIDDRKKVEQSLRETQTKLTVASRIAVASELTASIVHEISQPIAAMVANGQSCLRWLGTDPPNHDNAKAAVARIVRDGRDASEIIKGLRNLFKRAETQKSSVKLRAIVDEVFMLLQPRTQREGVHIELHIASDLPPLSGDPIQLQQVLLNLVSNAMDAMRLITGRPKILVMRAYQLPDNSVLTEIEDSGTGVLDHEKIFEAFFTTKESGMGMGLSVCKTIVTAHGGRLWAYPAHPFGTVFSFTIPTETTATENPEQ